MHKVLRTLSEDVKNDDIRSGKWYRRILVGFRLIANHPDELQEELDNIKDRLDGNAFENIAWCRDPDEPYQLTVLEVLLKHLKGSVRQ